MSDGNFLADRMKQTNYTSTETKEGWEEKNGLLPFVNNSYLS